MFDIVIIGGGIGGMYCCYELSKQKKVLLLDERNYLGGRVKTHYRPQFEIGAGRFHSSHSILLSLVESCKLHKIQIGGPKDYIQENGLFLQNANKYFEPILKMSLKKSNDYSKQKLQNITFREYLEQTISKKEVSMLIYIFGYSSEFNTMNAYDAIRSFKNEFSSKGHFFILKEGLRKLIQCLENKSKSNGAIIKNNSRVIQVERDQNNNEICVFTHNQKYITHNVIFATKSSSLLHFPILKPIFKEIKSVKAEPLLRIYAKYPKNKFGEIWFDKLNTITTNNILRQIIPINPSTGLVMISYTDGKDVEPFLTNETKKLKSDISLRKIIKKQLNILFPTKDIPQPTFFYAYYWKEGCQYWKKGYNSDIISKKMIHPLDNIYICGESFSKRQCWMEGALETAQAVIKNINK